jgi:hypothetical protein
MRKWMPAVPVIGAYGFSVAAYSRIPAESLPDLSRLLPFSVGQGGPVTRDAVAWLLPTLALAIWLLLTGLAKVRGPARAVPDWLLNERVDASAISRFEPTFNTVIFAVVALIALMHVAFVGAALAWPASSLQVITAIFGLGMVAVGNVMPRVRPNWIVGIRTKRTLSDAATWARAHRVLGAMIMGVGLLVILLSVVAPRYAVVGGLGALLISFPFAYAIGTRAAQPQRAGS